MSEYHSRKHTHHHKHRPDSSTLFKERSLRNIEIRKKVEKGLKIALIIVAILMALAVVVVYNVN